MERLEQLALPPGESVELTPGGIHLMVFGLTHSPQPEEEVAFELELDNGEIIRMIARVQAVGAAAHHH
jgi:copper(I)-binding protein